MNYIYFHPALLILALLISGCASFTHKTPAWVDNPKSVYPESKFLVAVGAGDTRRAAENSAAANLSRIFEAHIESDERLLDKTSETNSDIQYSSDFTSDVNILSSQTLHNIQHAEAWKDNNGRYHAVAYLERRSTAAVYRDKIDEQTTRVNYLLSGLEQSTDPLKRFATLRTAVRHADQAAYVLRQLKVIHPASVAASTPSYSLNKLQRNLAEAAKAISVEINVDGDSEKRMTHSLENVVTRYGFVVGKPGILHMSGRIQMVDTGERDQGLYFVRYELMLQIKDTSGNVLATVNEKGREAHKTIEQARVRAFRTLENSIQETGAQRLDIYFDSLIDQP